MGPRRANADERRLQHVRAIRDAYYGPDKSLEHELAEKDARIAELTAEVDRLKAVLGERVRPEPEESPAERRTFNFYRD